MGLAYNITSAWAVDREFLNIYLVPLASLGCLWDPLGCPWAPLGCPWAPLGCPWAPLGCPWAPFGCPWAPLRCPWTALGCPWGPRGAPWGQIPTNGQILVSNTEKCVKFMKLSSKISFCVFASGLSGFPGSAVMECYSDPPSTRAGGQDDVSFTNFFKLKRHIGKYMARTLNPKP